MFILQFETCKDGFVHSTMFKEKACIVLNGHPKHHRIGNSNNVQK